MSRCFYFLYQLGGLNEKLFLILYSTLKQIDCIVFLSYLCAILFWYKTFCLIFVTLVFFKIYSLLRLEGHGYAAYKSAFESFFRLGFVFAVFVLIYSLIKYCMAMPRPQVISSFPRMFKPEAHSFPSAHAGLASLLFTYYFASFSLTSRLLLALLVLCVGLSRIALGVHYPSDVLWGIALAPCVVALSNFLNNLVSPLVRQIKVKSYLILIKRRDFFWGRKIVKPKP